MSQLELKRARLQSLARILSESGKLTLMFGSMSCTDLENIIMQHIDKEITSGVRATRSECWIAMKALVAHEAAHIKFSGKKAWQKANRHSNIMVHLVNIIEDARIERCMANLYPGTLIWFRFLNDYIFLNHKDWGTGPVALMKGLSCYAVVGRLPEGIANQKDVAGLIYKCAPHIDCGRLAPDTDTVYDCALEVLKIVGDYLKSLSPPPTSHPAGTYKPEKAPTGELDPRREPQLTKPEESEPGEMESASDSSDSKDEKASAPTDSGGSSGFESGPTDEGEGDNTADGKSGEDEDKPDPAGGKPTGGDNKPDDKSVDEDTGSADIGDSPVDDTMEPGDQDDESVENPVDEDNESSEGGESAGELEAPPFDEAVDGEFEAGESVDDEFEAGESVGDEFEANEPVDDEFEAFESGDESENDPMESELETEKDPYSDIGGETAGEPEVPHDGAGESIDMGEYTGLMEEADSEIENIESSSAREEKEKDRSSTPEIKESEISEALSKDIHEGCEFRLIKEHRPDHVTISRYDEIFSEVGPHVNKTVDEIRRILEYKATLTEKNLRKGRLHGNSLWKLHAKDPRVFYKVTEPNDTPNLAIYLLVDCSGSMSGLNIREAVKSACLLYETCAALKIPINITGFTGSTDKRNDVTHYRVITFDDSHDKRYNIAHLAARRENRDGYSVRVATKELLLRNEPQKVLIVLSDGLPEMPFRNYNGQRGVNDTAHAVREAEKIGLGVIGLYFGPSVHLPQVQRIYNNCIYVSDLSVLPAIIGRTLKRVISNP